MGGSTLCEQACSEAGWYGQLLALVIVGARALWLARKNKQLAVGAAKLEGKIEALSVRPPAMPIQIALGPEAIEGIATSLRASLPNPSLWPPTTPYAPRDGEPARGTPSLEHEPQTEPPPRPR
jgi:hypothetical protein